MATVVMQQPYIKTQNTGWSSGIFDCSQDMNSSCYAFCCFPCFAFATTEEFGESTCLPLMDIFRIPLCVPPVTLGMRVALRYKYNITGSLFDDIVKSCCCIWCSWCQMKREMKARKPKVTVQSTTTTMFQPIPMATTTQVVPTQPVVHGPPVAVQTYPTTVMQTYR